MAGVVLFSSEYTVLSQFRILHHVNTVRLLGFS